MNKSSSTFAIKSKRHIADQKISNIPTKSGFGPSTRDRHKIAGAPLSAGVRQKRKGGSGFICAPQLAGIVGVSALLGSAVSFISQLVGAAAQSWSQTASRAVSVSHVATFCRLLIVQAPIFHWQSLSFLSSENVMFIFYHSIIVAALRVFAACSELTLSFTASSEATPGLDCCYWNKWCRVFAKFYWLYLHIIVP